MDRSSAASPFESLTDDELDAVEETIKDGRSAAPAEPLTLVPCFVCGKNLCRVANDEPMQPYEAVICLTTGNYGSRVLDSCFVENEPVMFLVCDECLVRNAGRTRRAVVKHARPETTYTEWPLGH